MAIKDPIYAFIVKFHPLLPIGWRFVDRVELIFICFISDENKKYPFYRQAFFFFAAVQQWTLIIILMLTRLALYKSKEKKYMRRDIRILFGTTDLREKIHKKPDPLKNITHNKTQTLCVYVFFSYCWAKVHTKQLMQFFCMIELEGTIVQKMHLQRISYVFSIKFSASDVECFLSWFETAVILVITKL